MLALNLERLPCDRFPFSVPSKRGDRTGQTRHPRGRDRVVRAAGRELPFDGRAEESLGIDGATLHIRRLAQVERGPRHLRVVRRLFRHRQDPLEDALRAGAIAALQEDRAETVQREKQPEIVRSVSTFEKARRLSGHLLGAAEVAALHRAPGTSINTYGRLRASLAGSCRSMAIVSFSSSQPLVSLPSHCSAAPR
jgi:hypothetical protein